MDFTHALDKVHTVILHRSYTNISAGGQRIVLLCDFRTACHLAQTGNMAVLALTELLIEPSALLQYQQDITNLCSKFLCFLIHALVLLLGQFFLGDSNSLLDYIQFPV